jgi:hypothetical protein
MSQDKLTFELENQVGWSVMFTPGDEVVDVMFFSDSDEGRELDGEATLTLEAARLMYKHYRNAGFLVK